MDDDLIFPMPLPTPDRPLTGITALVVEDSRFASEAIRLLCLKSGARIRRADCLHSARRHLRVYRPSVVIVDMGLPDGSGATLIEELSSARDATPAVIGLSGDPAAEDRARRAGAHGFLAKPVSCLATFQQAVIDALPGDMRPQVLRPLVLETVSPDPVALAEDLLNAVDLLSEARASGEFAFLVHFLRGVALSARDDELRAACEALAGDGKLAAARLKVLLEDRLGPAAA